MVQFNYPPVLAAEDPIHGQRTRHSLVCTYSGLLRPKPFDCFLFIPAPPLIRPENNMDGVEWPSDGQTHVLLLIYVYPQYEICTIH